MLEEIRLFFICIFLSRHVRDRTPYIIKYNLRTERVEATITVSDYTPWKTYYKWGGQSGVDLAVDEHGLWVLWGSPENGNQLKAAKIDVKTNRITRTWSLNTGITTQLKIHRYD